MVCVETRHMQAVLKAQINKTDRNDARGIAQMMRVGLYRPVHVKTLRSQKLRMLLTHRKLLQSKAIAIENDLRGTLRNFGLKVGMVGTAKFEARIKELIENLPDLAVLIEPLLVVRRALREQFVILHRRLLALVRDDEVCRRLMTTPGVGPVVALTYRATVDVPARFRKSKAVGASNRAARQSGTGRVINRSTPQDGVFFCGIVAALETTIINSDQARQRAEKSFKQKERARDGRKVMTEEAQARTIREKTARLKALRLAK